MLFENKADQDVYQDHPVHHQFVENCAHLWEKVIVYDSDDV
jgi:Stress responsive A/B Barrel Domain